MKIRIYNKELREEIVYTYEDEVILNKVLQFLLKKASNDTSIDTQNSIDHADNNSNMEDTSNGDTEGNNFANDSDQDYKIVTRRIVTGLADAGWDPQAIFVLEKILSAVPQTIEVAIEALREEGINV